MTTTKKLSTFWRVIIGIAAGFVALVLLLWAIPLNSGAKLAKPSVIQIHQNGAVKLEFSDTAGGGLYADEFNEIWDIFNKSNKNSALRSLLSNNWSGAQLDKVDEEEDIDERLTEAQVNAERGGEFMLVFIYDDVQTHTVKGTEFRYNRAKVLLSDTLNEVGEYVIILWNTNDFAPSGQPPIDYDLRISRIYAKGVNSKVVEQVKALLDIED